jgi:hypothetical protein
MSHLSTNNNTNNSNNNNNESTNSMLDHLFQQLLEYKKSHDERNKDIVQKIKEHRMKMEKEKMELDHMHSNQQQNVQVLNQNYNQFMNQLKQKWDSMSLSHQKQYQNVFQEHKAKADAQYGEKLNQIKKNLAIKNTSYQNLQRDMEQLKKEYELKMSNLQTKSQESNSKYQTLEGQMSTLQKQHDDWEREYDLLDERNKKMMEQHEDELKRNKELNNAITALQNKLDQTSVEMNNLKQSKTLSNSSNQEKAKMIGDLKVAQEKLQKQLQDLELEKAKSEKELAQQLVTETDKLKKQHQEFVQQSETDFKEMEKKFEESKEQIKTYISVNERLVNENQIAQDSLRQQISNLKQLNEQMDAKNKEYEQTIEAMKTSQQQSIADLNNIQSEKSQLDATLNQLEQEVGSLKNQLGTRDKTIELFEEEKKTDDGMKKVLKEKLEMLQNSINKLEDNKKDLENDYNTKIKEIDTKAEQILSLEAKNKELQIQQLSMNQNKDSINQLKSQLDQLQSNQSKYLKENKILLEEIERMKQDFATQKKDLVQMKDISNQIITFVPTPITKIPIDPKTVDGIENLKKYFHGNDSVFNLNRLLVNLLARAKIITSDSERKINSREIKNHDPVEILRHFARDVYTVYNIIINDPLLLQYKSLLQSLPNKSFESFENNGMTVNGKTLLEKIDNLFSYPYSWELNNTTADITIKCENNNLNLCVGADKTQQFLASLRRMQKVYENDGPTLPALNLLEFLIKNEKMEQGHHESESFKKFFEIVTKMGKNLNDNASKITQLLEYLASKAIVKSLYYDDEEMINSSVYCFVVVRCKDKEVKGNQSFKIKTDEYNRCMSIEYDESKSKYKANTSQSDGKTPVAKISLPSISKNDFFIYGPFTQIFKPLAADEMKNENKELFENKIMKNTWMKQFLNKKTVFLVPYGQSGAGKTSIMIYNTTTHEEGILIRTCNEMSKMTDLFNKLDIKMNEYGINERNNFFGKTYTFQAENGKWIDKKTSKDWIVQTKDNSRMKENDLTSYIMTGLDLRKQSPTPNNEESSRSHIIIYMDFYLHTDGGMKSFLNNSYKLIVGDFAGVENEFECGNTDVIKQFYNLYSGDIPFQRFEKIGIPDVKKYILQEIGRQYADLEQTFSYVVEWYKVQTNKIFTEIENNKVYESLNTSVEWIDFYNQRDKYKIDSLTLGNVNTFCDMIGQHCNIRQFIDIFLFPSDGKITPYPLSDNKHSTTRTLLGGWLRFFPPFLFYITKSIKERKENFKNYFKSMPGSSDYSQPYVSIENEMNFYTNCETNNLNFLLIEKKINKDQYESMGQFIKQKKIIKDIFIQLFCKELVLDSPAKLKKKNLADSEIIITKGDHIEIEQYNSIIYHTILKLLYNSQEIKQACISRVNEGKYINDSLSMFRNLFSSILKSKGQIPKALPGCALLQCNPLLGDCFGSTFENKNSIKDIFKMDLFSDIISYVSGIDDLQKHTEENILIHIKDIVFGIFNVIDISSNKNNPPTIPFINNTEFIQLFVELKTYFNQEKEKLKYSSNVEYVGESAEDEKSLLTKIKKCLEKFEEENNKKKTNDMLINFMEQSQKARAELKSNIVNRMMNRDQFLMQAVASSLYDFIEMIDKYNAPTLLGTMSFIDSLAKGGMNKMPCSRSAIAFDDEVIQKKIFEKLEEGIKKDIFTK